jgi:hypothetical protein
MAYFEQKTQNETTDEHGSTQIETEDGEEILGKIK